MKILTSLLCLACAGVLWAEADPVPPTEMKLILCMGQSNMAGRGRPEASDREPVANVWKLTRENTWVRGSTPYHFDRDFAGVGPVDEFVRRYVAAHPGETVGVVPCAVGGSGVATWFESRKGDKGKNLETALARAQVALSNGTFIAILWHQGETDAAKWDQKRIDDRYANYVATAAKAARRVVGEDVPFVAGEIGRWLRRNDADHAAKINPAINRLSAVVPYATVVSSEGLTNGDEHHFDRASQIILGARYYEAWDALVKAPKPAKDEAKPKKAKKSEYLRMDRDFSANPAGAASPLRGKKIAFIGDSYVQNHRRPATEAWHCRFAETNAMHYLNFGRNGNMLVFEVEKRGTPVRIRYREIPEDVDAIVAIGGHNDTRAISLLKGVHTPKGDPEEIKAKQAECAAEFRAGVKQFLADVKRDYPKAKLVVVTPWAVDRSFFPEVIASLTAECAAANVPCIDASKLSGLMPNDVETRTRYFQAPNDVAHLNAEGHGVMLEKIAPVLAAMLAD